MHSIIYNSIIYNRALTPPLPHTHSHMCGHTHWCVCVGFAFLVIFSFFFKSAALGSTDVYLLFPFFCEKEERTRRGSLAQRPKKFKKKATNQAKRGGELRDKQEQRHNGWAACPPFYPFFFFEKKKGKKGQRRLRSSPVSLLLKLFLKKKVKRSNFAVRNEFSYCWTASHFFIFF